MKRTLAGTAGIGIGAALMYLLDPERGKRRRALLRDKVRHIAHSTGTRLDAKSRDAANRMRGLVARTKSLLAEERVSDAVVAERVRSRVGHAVSHPGSVEVAVENGRLTLRGEVPSGEVDRLLGEAERVPGVESIQNKLEPRAELASTAIQH